MLFLLFERPWREMAEKDNVPLQTKGLGLCTTSMPITSATLSDAPLLTPPFPSIPFGLAVAADLWDSEADFCMCKLLSTVWDQGR